MSYSSVKRSIPDSDPGAANNGSGNAAANCCSRASSELKLYQAFIFSVPIFFTFVLLLLFYLFYLRRRRVDWSSLRMRTANSLQISEAGEDASRCELGVKKELREMLPIVVFKESFSVKDTQCSVCLGDYQAEDKLQQIPACRHTFHMDCIDLWLATHTTCPLCRQSLLASSKIDSKSADGETVEHEADVSHSSRQNGHLPDDEDVQAGQQPTTTGSEPETEETTVVESGESGDGTGGGDDNVDVKSDDDEVVRRDVENAG